MLLRSIWEYATSLCMDYIYILSKVGRVHKLIFLLLNVSKMKVTKILTKGVNKGNIRSTGKERSMQIVPSRTALH